MERRLEEKMQGRLDKCKKGRKKKVLINQTNKYGEYK